MLAEFVAQDLNKFRVYLHCKLLYLIQSIFQVGLGIPGELLHLPIPGVLFAQLPRRQDERGGCQLWRLESQQCCVQERYFHEVLGVKEHFIVVEGAWQSPVPLQEPVCAWHSDHEIKLVQNFFLHVEHLLPGELILAHLQELVQVRWVDLFVLRSDPEGRYTKQVQLILLNFLLAHVLIDDVDSNVESLGQKSELTVDINDPLNQKGSWSVFNFGLYLLEVFVIDHVLIFLPDHVLVDFLGELRDVLGVSEVELVREGHIFHNRLFPELNSFLKDFFDRFCWSILFIRNLRFEDYNVLRFCRNGWIIVLSLLWLLWIFYDFIIIVGRTFLFIELTHIVLILLGLLLISLHLTFCLLRANWFGTYLIHLRPGMVHKTRHFLLRRLEHSWGVLAAHPNVAAWSTYFSSQSGGADASTSFVVGKSWLRRSMHNSVFSFLVHDHYGLVVMESTVSSSLM